MKFNIIPVVVALTIVFSLTGCQKLEQQNAQAAAAAAAAQQAQSVIDFERMQAWMQTCKNSQFAGYHFNYYNSSQSITMHCADGTTATFH